MAALRRLSLPSLPRLSWPQRLKGGRLERWGDYWVQMGRDYRESFITIGQQARDSPGKASVYAALTAACIWLTRSNPTERDLRSRVVEHQNSAALLGEAIRSKEVQRAITHIEECFTNGTLRRWNFILFSLFWEDNHNAGCALYKATTPHLKPRLSTVLRERVLDLGLGGRFWRLEALVADFDVNEDEWDEHGRQREAFKSSNKGAMGMI